jgi:hypothetical protein
MSREKIAFLLDLCQLLSIFRKINNVNLLTLPNQMKSNQISAHPVQEPKLSTTSSSD